MRYRYRIVDVFTTQPLEGNPLAVFPDAAGVPDATMQKIARELNLSETTFVLPATRAECAARVRIFTPKQEMVFAGHPILGTSFVLRDEGRVAKTRMNFNLDIKVGLVPVRVEPMESVRFWLTTPPITWGTCYERGACARALGLDREEGLEIAPQLLSAGNPHIFIAVKDKGAVDRAQLDWSSLRRLKDGQTDPIGVFVFTPTTEGAYSRMFAPDFGVAEDPATGSATGPLAAYMMRHKLVAGTAGTRFHSEQGTAMGRRSILYVQVNGDQGADSIEVGGHVVALADGAMRL